MRLRLALTLWLLAAAPASAEVRVYDIAAGAVSTPVRGEAPLLAWSDDGAGILVGSDARRVDVASRTVTRLPALDGATAIGPGGRWLDGVVLRGADGRRVATLPSSFSEGAKVAWAPDGSRVAVARGFNRDGELLVLDTATGAVIRRQKDVDGVSPQAFAPDGTALLAASGPTTLEIRLPSGRVAPVFFSITNIGPEAAWGPDGRMAFTDGSMVELDGAGLRVAGARSPLWGADGMLAHVFARTPDGCSPSLEGVGLIAGGRRTALLEPSPREVRRLLWSPDGRRLAVDVGPDPAKGRTWPKRVARDYAMFTPRGDAAVRRLVLRAARALRRGATREAVMRRVRRDFEAIDRRFDGASDTAVLEALANELDRWLLPAGFAPIDAHTDISCLDLRR